MAKKKKRGYHKLDFLLSQGGKVYDRNNQLIRRRRNQPRYKAYLQSPEWQIFRATIFAKRGRKCQKCFTEKGSIQVHHLHYRNLGNERPEDVLVLCGKCHKETHQT